MTIKHTKHRVGPFDRTKTEWTLVHIDDDENRTNVERPGEMEEIGRTLLQALSPRGRVSRWRRHADRLNVAGDLLDAAEALINDQGTVENMDRFDALMAQAEMAIERAQNEKLDIYGKVGRQARHQRDIVNQRWENDNAEVREIIKRLALDKRHRNTKPAELWFDLMSELEMEGFDIEESGKGTDKVCEHDSGTLKYKAFAKLVERAREPKK